VNIAQSDAAENLYIVSIWQIDAEKRRACGRAPPKKSGSKKWRM